MLPNPLLWVNLTTKTIHPDRLSVDPPHHDASFGRAQARYFKAANNLERAGCIRLTQRPMDQHSRVSIAARGYEALEYREKHRWWMIWHRPPF